MKKSQIKKIKDLNQASVLKALKFRNAGIEWEGNVAFWLFQDNENKAEDVITEFINGELLGNIKEFVEAQNTLKSMLFNR